MPTGSFELFVARRYLRAKRKEAAVSLITAISVIGVAAGVMALVIALAINNGFRDTLQRNLLNATAHVNIMAKNPAESEGLRDWRALIDKLKTLPYVTEATPSLYDQTAITSPQQTTGLVLKGIDVKGGPSANESLRNLKAGHVADLLRTDGLPGIILGSELARATGLGVRNVATVLTTELTPIGPRPVSHRFRVVGIFETGFYQLDSLWGYTTLAAAQRILGLPDVVNSVELRLSDIYRAQEVADAAEKIIGPNLTATTWMEQNRQLDRALRMERVVTVITISLIQLVAALNIFITLVLMVMEKYRDIAVLLSMGARREQIRRIFIWQGVLIGAVGSVIGLTVGHILCYFADKYHWVRLDAELYALSFVPFEPRWWDSLWIAGAALLVSFVATLYPANSATRVTPVEALRYE